MKQPPILVALLLALLPCISAQGLEKDGLQVTVTESTLERDSTQRGPSIRVAVVLKTLKTTVRNLSMQPLPEGKVDYVILTRPSQAGARLQRYDGTDPIPALGGGREVVLNVGAFELRDQRFGRHRFDDALAGWRMSFQTGNRTVLFESSPTFGALEKTAVPARQVPPQDTPAGEGRGKNKRAPAGE